MQAPIPFVLDHIPFRERPYGFLVTRKPHGGSFTGSMLLVTRDNPLPLHFVTNGFASANTAEELGIFADPGYNAPFIEALVRRSAAGDLNIEFIGNEYLEHSTLRDRYIQSRKTIFTTLYEVIRASLIGPAIRKVNKFPEHQYHIVPFTRPVSEIYSHRVSTDHLIDIITPLIAKAVPHKRQAV